MSPGPTSAGRVPLALVTALVAISFAAPLFRLAAPTPPLVAAGLRLAFAAALLLPFTWRGLRGGRLEPRARRAAVLAGLLYAVHFGAWVTSLALTSVAASVTLVTATPLLLALAGVVTGRDAPDRRLWGALVLAAVGLALIGGHDLANPAALAGDGLALLGAAAMAAYLALGRHLGPSLDVAAFAGVATAVGAAALLGTAALLGLPPRPAGADALAALVAAALLPQLVGHSLLTWALRHARAAVVAMTTVGEPVGASLLAWLWLGESVSPPVMLGGAITLTGVALALSGRPAAG